MMILHRKEKKGAANNVDNNLNVRKKYNKNDFLFENLQYRVVLIALTNLIYVISVYCPS